MLSVVMDNEDIPPPIREIAVFPMDREQGRPVLFVSCI